jgi:hypothetical protein
VTILFRGIDPDGLACLAAVVASHGSSTRHSTRGVVEILSRNGRTTDVLAITTVVGRLEDWARSTGDTMRWRADAIERGQAAHFSLSATLRANFATAAVFSLDNIDESYRGWIDQFDASRRRVTESMTNVSAWLDQGWTDWDVTNTDLHNIWTALAGLTSAELEDVIAGLSPTQLERWIDEMGNGINGFSRSEKQDVFALLAKCHDSLGRIHDAILASGSSADALDFGTAIQETAGDTAITNFVTHLLATDLKATEYSTVALAFAVSSIEEPATLNHLINQIVTSDTVSLIAADSLTATADGGADPLASLGMAMSRVTDPAVAAAAFCSVVTLATDAAAQQRLLTRSKDAEWLRTASLAMAQVESQLLEMANQILSNDAEEIVQWLATVADPTGGLTTDYLYELVDRKDSGQIGTIATALRGGDAVDPLTFAALGHDPDYRYPHAQNLAFLAGTLNNALARYADHAKDDINLITAAAAAANMLISPLFAALNTGLPTAIGEAALGYGIAASTQRDIDSYLESIHDIVDKSLQPEVTLDGTPHELGESALWWDRRYRIVRSGGGNR